MNEIPDADQYPLPGLDVPQRPAGTAEAGVRRQLAKLHADGHLTEANAASAAIALVMAQVVDKKHLMAKPSSTIAMDARMVLDALEPLTPAGSEIDDDLAQTMTEWSEAQDKLQHQEDRDAAT